MVKRPEESLFKGSSPTQRSAPRSRAQLTLVAAWGKTGLASLGNHSQSYRGTLHWKSSGQRLERQGNRSRCIGVLLDAWRADCWQCVLEKASNHAAAVRCFGWSQQERY